MGIKVGPIEIEDPVILAPMSGVTDLPYRRLVKKLGAGLVVSEMIASEAMIRQSRRSLRMAASVPEEAPMAVQLAGCEPEVMAEAARLNVDRGAAIIDINMGCPVKKVVNGHAGSALMRDEAHAARILEATVKAVSVPVTLKMRTGWDDANRNAPSLARIAEQVGIRMITVHGRTRSQMFNGRADWTFIRAVKDAVTIPVIANGDVTTVDDARRILDDSGADGVMVGRGMYGRPWFIRQITAFLKSGVREPDPAVAERYAILREHYDAMLSHYGRDVGSRVARKHIGWYTKGLPESAGFRGAVNTCADPDAVFGLMDRYFTGLADACAA
jgi:tRNA-dihydrouridine synthase B